MVVTLDGCAERDAKECDHIRPAFLRLSSCACTDSSSEVEELSSDSRDC